MITCEKCRHWDALSQRGYRIDGKKIEYQARCLVDYPSRPSAPLRWHWDRCAKFAPDLREYQVPNPGAVVTDIRVVR